jgi:hypothetical protein
MAWGIQTVYIPRENLSFLEEWIQYHMLLGAEYFYLYDNTGSTVIEFGNAIAVSGKNKYGVRVDWALSDSEIAEIEGEILRKYPVKKISWRPMRNGRIVHGLEESCDHFAETTSVDWCAFIDIDEFLCSPFKIDELLEGSAVRISQKKFENRFSYETALEITRTFSINTERWAPKLIVKMADYIGGSKSISIHDIPTRNPPICLNMETMRFNHYNHNKRGHQWLLNNYKQFDQNWQPKRFEEVFDEKCTILSEFSKKIKYDRFTVTKRQEVMGRDVGNVSGTGARSLRKITRVQVRDPYFFVFDLVVRCRQLLTFRFPLFGIVKRKTLGFLTSSRPR